MTDEILKLAKEHFADPDGSLFVIYPELIAFAKAIRNQALEDAAKVCEKFNGCWYRFSEDCIHEIRALRGEM